MAVWARPRGTMDTATHPRMAVSRLGEYHRHGRVRRSQRLNHATTLKKKIKKLIIT